MGQTLLSRIEDDLKFMEKNQWPLQSQKKKLFPGNACFVLDENRGDCFCRDRSLHKNGEFTTVMDMCQLETYYQSKAEAGDTDQGVTYYVNHLSFSP
jgi:hypothetical protein